METKKILRRPSLERYKQQADALLKRIKSGHLQELQRLKKWHPHIGKLPDSELQRTKPGLSDAQLVIAREHAFETWSTFAKHLKGLSRNNSPISKFESAVDAVVTGQIVKLKRMLRADPGLVRRRSTRLHHATLLNYVGANGVEDYRQKTPKNVVEVAEILLKAGADIRAIADLYGGSDTLGLAATSIFPCRAGVQNALIDILIKYGADLNEAGLVNGCLRNGRGQAAEHLAKRGVRLDLEGAAGTGQLDVVKAFFTKDGRLKAGATGMRLHLGVRVRPDPSGRVSAADGTECRRGTLRNNRPALGGIHRAR